MNKVVTICTQSGFCQFHGAGQGGAGQGLLFVGQGAGQGSLFFRGAGRASLIPASPFDRLPECFVISFMSASFRHFHSDRLKTHISWFLEVPETKKSPQLNPKVILVH